MFCFDKVRMSLAIDNETSIGYVFITFFRITLFFYSKGMKNNMAIVAFFISYFLSHYPSHSFLILFAIS